VDWVDIICIDLNKGNNSYRGTNDSIGFYHLIRVCGICS